MPLIQSLIQSIELDHVVISAPDRKITGKYKLVAEGGKIVAKQGFNGYDETPLEMSRETREAMEDFLAGLKEDIEITAGINAAVRELKK
jgi:hypothetical protein